MVERRVVDRDILIKKLTSMTYEHIDEAQMRYIFISLGRTIQIEEEGDADAVQTDCRESEQSTESNRNCTEEQGN